MHNKVLYIVAYKINHKKTNFIVKDNKFFLFIKKKQ